MTTKSSTNIRVHNH